MRPVAVLEVAQQAQQAVGREVQEDEVVAAVPYSDHSLAG